jgi:hypothetical protein
MFFLNLITPANEFSASERRRLSQFNGVFDSSFDDFAVDQTVFREEFRRLKAFFDMNILRKSDNNGIFVHDGFVFKTEYPLDTASVTRLCGVINSMYEKYLDESNRVWYSIAPDKNVFLSSSRHLTLDYDEMKRQIRENVNENIPYIEIFGDLDLQSYYRTDSHWRQEHLFGVLNTLREAMGFDEIYDSYKHESFDRFFGVYYGQSALNIAPDELIWLVNDTTRNAIVTSAEKTGRLAVYDLAQLESVDPYNIFMQGPAAIVTAQNPANSNGRELVIFRDSFASPLSALMLEAYSRITLVDLRYVNPDILDRFVDFEGADVLFLYSTGLFNNSESVRGLNRNA